MGLVWLADLGLVDLDLEFWCDGWLFGVSMVVSDFGFCGERERERERDEWFFVIIFLVYII